MEKPKSELVAKFLAMLDEDAPKGKQKEQVVQDFLESNTELIPTPNLLNHHLHFEAIVSKFPLGTEMDTDYVYLTKSSDRWRVTFVELESPDKAIFTDDMKRTIASAQFNAALAQVRSWKVYLDDRRDEVVGRLKPLLQPLGMRGNPIEFNFQLIIGRSKNKNASEDRRRHFNKIAEDAGIDIFTYDQLAGYYESQQKYQKLVLRLTIKRYAIKYMHFLPNHLLSYLGPDMLELSNEQILALKEDGYEMDKWLDGELLIFNNKYTAATGKAEMEETFSKMHAVKKT